QVWIAHRACAHGEDPGATVNCSRGAAVACRGLSPTVCPRSRNPLARLMRPCRHCKSGRGVMDTFEGDCGSSAEHEAVNRLYELAREGDTDSGEYLQLDSLVYDSLLRA